MNAQAVLMQEPLKQHSLLERINPVSVNTIRIDSFLDSNQIKIGGALLKMGSGRTIADNWRYGGVVAKVDLADGKLATFGKTPVSFGRHLVRKHPVTGVAFGGLQLPFWEEVKAAVCAGAKALEPLCYLGWDVAITRDGPVLIEANWDPDTYMFQEGIDGMRWTPVGQAALADRARQ